MPLRGVKLWAFVVCWVCVLDKSSTSLQQQSASAQDMLQHLSEPCKLSGTTNNQPLSAKEIFLGKLHESTKASGDVNSQLNGGNRAPLSHGSEVTRENTQVHEDDVVAQKPKRKKEGTSITENNSQFSKNLEPRNKSVGKVVGGKRSRMGTRANKRAFLDENMQAGGPSSFECRAEVQNCTDENMQTGVSATSETLAKSGITVKVCKKKMPKTTSKSNCTPAQEVSQNIEIVCQQCRRDKNSLRQQSIRSMFITATVESLGHMLGSTERSDLDVSATTNATQDVDGDTLVCSICRKQMEEQRKQRIGPSQSTMSGIDPCIMKMKQYKKTAKDKKQLWSLSDGECASLMNQECFFCSRSPSLNPDGVNGINRLNHSLRVFDKNNVAPACKECNQMKHNHTVEGFFSICRHIATHNKLGDYGLFPECFVDNHSPRSRSSYVTKSKTHVLTQEAFLGITSSDCFYCGKQNKRDGPTRHYNGLDRVDTTVRVYSQASAVSSCGTCNTMKWRRTVAAFLSHCHRVALHAVTLQNYTVHSYMVLQSPEMFASSNTST